MSYSIYRADLEKDKDEILKFWEENRFKSLDRKYEWIYEGNPSGRAIVFVLREDDSQQIVGMDVVFPRVYSVNGKEMLAGIIGDFLVSKHHRTLGPAIMIMRNVITAVRNNEVDFIYGFPNKNAESVIKRAGFECLGETRRLVKVIKTDSFLAKKKVPNRLIGIIAPVLDMILKISIVMQSAGKKRYICKEIRELDGSFDQIWTTLKSCKAVIGDRSASAVAWKYLRDPDDDNKIYGIYESDNFKLAGYIVYRLDAGSVEMRDIVFIKDKQVLKALITNFVRYVLPLNPISITLTILENDEIAEALRRFGFVPGRSDGKVYLYCNKNKEEELGAVRNPGNWWLMRSDEDS